MIRWAIWGTGAISHRVAKDLRAVPGASLEAIGSRALETARGFALSYGIPKFYAGLNSLLEDGAVDVVYVGAPAHRHCDDALAVLGAGKAVLCEKPFAINAAQAQRMVSCARERGLFCMEAMWTRFIPAIVEAKRYIDEDHIGQIRLVIGNFTYPASRTQQQHLFDVNHAGGALLDRGVYLISLAHHLLGPPRSVRASACIGTTGVDEQSGYQLAWESGALADLCSSLIVRATNDFIIAGDRGWIRILDPFYCAHELFVGASGRVAIDTGPTDIGGAGRRVITAAANSRWARGFRRWFGFPLPVNRGGTRRRLPFCGYGYQFELREVTRCLQEGKTESVIMPLGASVEVMQTLDKLRHQLGITYPQERT